APRSASPLGRSGRALMRIRCLRTGVVRERAGDRGARRYLSAPWRDEALPVNTFLVEHRDGLCLFDTGQTARATAPGYFPWWQPFFRLARFELTPDDEISAQLHGLGVAPGDLRWVVLSHLHTDHVGDVGSFRGCDVVVSSTEWELARGLKGRIRGYLPQYWPAGLAPTEMRLDAGGFGPFPGAYDLSRDGSLVVGGTPAPTAGHRR